MLRLCLSLWLCRCLYGRCQSCLWPRSPFCRLLLLLTLRRNSHDLPSSHLVVPLALVLTGVDFNRYRKHLSELDVHLLHLLGSENIEADFLRVHLLCLQDIVLAHPCVTRALRYALFWRQYRDYLSCYFHYSQMFCVSLIIFSIILLARITLSSIALHVSSSRDIGTTCMGLVSHGQYATKTPPWVLVHIISACI